MSGVEIHPADVEIVPLDSVRRHPANARLHDLPTLRESLRVNGQYRSIIANRRTGLVLAGNGTHEALELEGSGRVKVEWVDVSDAAELRIVAVDNRANDLASYDEARRLALLEQTAAANDGSLLGTGYDEDALEALEALHAEGHAGDDGEGGGEAGGRPDVEDVPEAVQPVSQPGDLWLLGPHRLLIGDSHVPDDVDRLLGGRTVDTVITDPPYAIYGSSSGVTSDVTDDKMVRPFFEGTWRTIQRVLKTFGHAYMCCDWRSWSAIWESAKRAGIAPKNMLVWDKGHFGMGSNYGNTHELLYFGSKMPRQRTMSSGTPKGQRQVHRANILRYERASGDERLHNAAKPVPMLEELIENSTDPGELVLDLFGGSGSTLIAAHRKDRVAAVMELEPGTADIICLRFQRLTGIRPVRESTGEAVTFIPAAGGDSDTEDPGEGDG